jgi:hypothetical protein
MDKYKTAEGVRQLVKVIVASDEFGRPLVAPPGVAPDRIKLLRDAFNKAVNDPRCWPKPRNDVSTWIQSGEA